MGKKGSTGRTGTTPAQQAFAEAEQAQQRGERRRGQDAVRQYQAAVERYEAALRLGLEPEQRVSAIVLRAEALQEWAREVLGAEAALPDAEQSAALEARACASAVAVLQRAIQALRGLRDEAGGVWQRDDAAVNCGNCLSELAELMSAAEAVPLLQEAIACYQAALELEADAVTCSNLADVYIQLAQACADAAGDGAAAAHEAASAHVSTARIMYERAATLSSSEDGDDLPGMLANWGTGLLAAGKIAAAAGVGAQAVALFQDALSRLQASASFNRMDIQVAMVLAETHATLAEAVPAAEAAQHVAHALQAASQALQIDATHGNALTTKAECHAAAARVAAALAAGLEASMQLQEARDAYRRALARPQALGSCSERCTLRYNYACVLAGCGDATEALAVLRLVAEKDPGALQGADQDPDLRGVYERLQAPG